MSEREWLNVFSDNLIELMNEQGYSQRDLADAAGLSEGSVSSYVNKRKMPSLRAIINMAYVLDCDFNDFIDFGDRIY